MRRHSRGDGAPGALHDIFARRAAEAPGQVAIHSDAESITYGALDRRVDAWTAVLRSHGVGPGHIVPVLLPRSLDLVTAILAVLRAGAAYAPLDPAWPSARVAEVIDDLPTTVVMGPVRAGAADPSEPPVQIRAAVAAPTPLLPRGLDPVDRPACVFFTSGSTGRPKGVVVPHAALARLFVDDSFAPFGPDLVIPLAAATSWDAFALEMWAALLSGGTGVLVEQPFLTPEVLRDVIGRHGVNTAWLTSSLFNMITEEDIDVFAGLTQLMIGGERLSERHVAAFMEAHPDVALTNGYGPVESTVFITTHRIGPGDLLRPGGIPIGICVPGTTVYVLDGDRECGRDEEGEICVAGDGLAIAYLNDPDLTAERFCDIELRGRRQRVYRTGDLGAWASPDGLLQFRGRADRQVKIRGHRIEPQGVEALVVELCDEVARCQVVARQAADGSTELVAFCQSAPGHDLDSVLPRLRAELPAHLVPSEVVEVNGFPLTSSGKLDSRALLDSCSRQTVVSLPAPSGVTGLSPTEDVVRDVFGSLLSVAPGPETSFFEAGGTSLAAGRACSRLGRELAVDVPLSAFYEHPTIRGLASWIDGTAGRAVDHDVSTADPLTPMQEAFLMRDVVDPGGLSNHCVLTWILDGEIDLPRLSRAVAAVHQRHRALRARYCVDVEEIDHDSRTPPPPIVTLDPGPDVEEVRDRVLDHLSSPFDLGGGLVWTVVLAAVAHTTTTVLGVAVHHVAFDGWSEGVLAHDLSRAYQTGSLAAPLPTAAPRAVGSVDASLVADRLRGAEPLHLPPPRAPVEEPPVARHRATIVPAQVLELSRTAGQQRVTPFHLLLAAWLDALHCVLDAADPVVGVPVSTRHRVDQETEIGCFVVMAPVRTGPRRGARAVDLLGAVRAAADAAMTQLDVPPADVVSALGSDYQGHLYDSIFAFQNIEEPVLDLDDTTCRLDRPVYFDLPTALHCECWLRADGSIDLEVLHLRDVLDDAVAADLAAATIVNVEQLTRELG